MNTEQWKNFKPHIKFKDNEPVEDINLAWDMAHAEKPHRDVAKDEAERVLAKYKQQEGFASGERVSIEQAKKIFGADFYGPEKYKEKFNREFPEAQIPELPSLEKMEKCKSLGMVLILVVYEEAKAPEWKMLKPRVLQLFNADQEIKKHPMFLRTDYASQTWLLRDYLKKHDLISEEVFSEASDKLLQDLNKQLITDPAGAMKQLTELKINQIHRNSLDGIRYFAKVMSETDKFGRVTSPKLGSDYEVVNDYNGKYIRVLGLFNDERSFDQGNYSLRGGDMFLAVGGQSKQSYPFGELYALGIRPLV